MAKVPSSKLWRCKSEFNLNGLILTRGFLRRCHVFFSLQVSVTGPLVPQRVPFEAPSPVKSAASDASLSMIVCVRASLFVRFVAAE